MSIVPRCFASGLLIEYAVKVRRRRRLKSVRVILFCAAVQTLLFYAAFLSAVKIADIRDRNELERFDLNKDGFFNAEELTAECEKALQKNYGCGTGRALLPIAGVFFSILYFPFAAGIEFAGHRIARLHSARRVRKKRLHRTRSRF